MTIEHSRLCLQSVLEITWRPETQLKRCEVSVYHGNCLRINSKRVDESSASMLSIYYQSYFFLDSQFLYKFKKAAFSF